MRFSQKQLIASLMAIVFFMVAWYLLAKNLTAWGDEINHLAIGKGLSVSGKPLAWSFDEGKMSSWPYTKRGLIISYLSRFAYQAGEDFCLMARIIPLVFTLLTFLIYILYVRRRFNVLTEQLSLAAVLFFGQSVVLEQSLYVRPYSSLALFVLISLITCWEGLKSYKNSRWLHALLFWGISIMILSVPTADGWQYQHIPIVLFAFLLGLGAQSSLFKEYVRHHRASIGMLIIAIFIFAPFVAMGGDLLMSKLITGNRAIGRSFVTFWDNLAGLIRYAWVLNICFIGLLLPLVRKKNLEWNFQSWLFYTGIVSGILIGLLNPHNHIFYSRFFYVSIVLTVLGFSSVLFQATAKSLLRTALIVIYVLFNVAASFLNFYYEHNNIKKPIEWLNTHLNNEDALLVFSSELELNGGKGLITRAYIISSDQDPQQIKALISFIEKNSFRTIYYLYSNHYEFRDNLYKITMNENRAPPADLYRYLKDRIPSENVLGGLRGCGLVKYRKEDLTTGLNGLLEEGYPQRFKGIEKRFLKKILHLPDTSSNERIGQTLSRK